MTKYTEPSSDLSDLDLPNSDDEIATAKTSRSKMRKSLNGSAVPSKGKSAAGEDDGELMKYQGKC